MDHHTIYRNATIAQLMEAVDWTSERLHIPRKDVTVMTAIAYVCRHFEAGELSGWDGFVKNLEA